jgi:16S rRNA (guanine527-N7)-methyltransferase
MEELQAKAQALGISLTESHLQAFSTYYEELISWNTHTNITAITEKQDVIIKHFLDSLTIIPYLNPQPHNIYPHSVSDIASSSVHDSNSLIEQVTPDTSSNILKLIDIGTGAGFPGIPLKIVKPELEVTLLEPIGKKVEFLKHIVQTLHLEHIQAINGRAEELGQNPHYRGQFDIVTARAVAHLSTLAEYALPLLKVGGMLICQKNRSDEELKEAEQAITELGGTLKTQIPVSIPELAERSIIVIEKVAPTPEKYPRRTGVPSKKPL